MGGKKVSAVEEAQLRILEATSGHHEVANVFVHLAGADMHHSNGESTSGPTIAMRCTQRKSTARIDAGLLCLLLSSPTTLSGYATVC